MHVWWLPHPLTDGTVRRWDVREPGPVQASQDNRSLLGGWRSRCQARRAEEGIRSSTWHTVLQHWYLHACSSWLLRGWRLLRSLWLLHSFWLLHSEWLLLGAPLEASFGAWWYVLSVLLMVQGRRQVPCQPLQCGSWTTDALEQRLGQPAACPSRLGLCPYIPPFAGPTCLASTLLPAQGGPKAVQGDMRCPLASSPLLLLL